MATKKVTLYPSKINTQASMSTETNTQILSEKENLKKDNKALAYWGVKKPTWKPSYLRRYPDSITSISGSFYKPANFTASGFKIVGADKRGKIKNIWVEYKWENISYSSTTAYGSFDKPVIQLKKGSKVLDSITGTKPEKNRYNNCKQDSCKNTDSANLATLHTKKFTGVSGLTVADLVKNVKVVFNPAKNAAHTHCRIVMQFFRIIVEYEPYKPKAGEPPQLVTTEEEEEPIIYPNFTITSSLNKNKVLVGEEYYYTVTVKNTQQDADIDGVLNILIDIPNNTEISVVDTIGYGSLDLSNGCRWNVSELVDDVAQIKLLCKTNARTDYALYASQFNYDITKQTNSSHASIKVVSEAIEFDFYATNLNKSMYETNDNPGSEFVVFFSSQELPKNDAKIIIETSGFIKTLNATVYGEGQWQNITNDYTLTLLDEKAGKWEISNIKTKKIKLSSNEVALAKQGAGKFTLRAVYKQGSNTIERNLGFTIVGRKLEKEYFKLRLEDGSDVQYNSLTITEGDDLEYRPSVTKIEDTYDEFKNNITIIGDTKRFSTKEAKYASFDVYIESEENKTYENVIAYLDAYDEDFECEEIIVGAESNIELYESNNGNTFCVIKELETNKHNQLKFILQSDTPREAVIKLKPLNYDEYDTGKWKPMRIYFKDIPNIQMKIKGPSEIIYNNDNEATFKLQYIIQNKSDVKGENVKFKIIEPSSFEKDIVPPKFSSQNNVSFNSPTFNKKNRTIYFPELDADKSTHILEVTYKATKKGIYNFIIQTLDLKDTVEDDQYYNRYEHKILVNVTSDLDIRTSISNSSPYLNDTIDYTIKVTNRSKRQENIVFNINDIGHYDNLHNKNDYDIIEWEGNGQFETIRTSEDDLPRNTIGVWKLKNVEAGETNKLTLTLQPKNTGVHVIKTYSYDKNKNIQSFEDYVQVYEPNKKIDLNVYHAVNETENENCCNPDTLTEVCDDDFITIGDDIYYVIEVINKEKNDVSEAKYVNGQLKRGANIQVKVRVPKTFKYDGCSTQDNDIRFTQDSSGLLTLYINNIPQCSSKKFCFKVTPQEKGRFVSNFILSARNTKTINKKLNLDVNSYFDEKKTQHEVTIYNFEKTNRYFRYELDGNNNLYKFYNKGDISKRTVDIEKHDASQIEVYKGSTLKELVDNIKENSKYVEPELIRIGNNHLANKGYELYPNGFINRFGLLNSEVYHYTGQLPTIGNLVDYALRWDVDKWDQKLWSGGLYQNGVFDLTIDYGKIPTNFNILELSKPLDNLQALVDRVKPFGTKAVCYFSCNVKFELKIVMDEIKKEIIDNEFFNLAFEDMGTISWYNKHDNSIMVTYDLTKYYMNIDENDLKVSLSSSDRSLWDNEQIIDEPELNYCIDVFDSEKSKESRKSIEDCYDIVENLQNSNEYTKNITISKNNIVEPSSNVLQIREKTFTTIQLRNEKAYNFCFDYDIDYDEKIGIYAEVEDGFVYCNFTKDHLTKNRFELIHPNGEIINTIHKENVNNFNIQIQCCTLDNSNNIMHFWISINTHDYEYLGYYIFRSIYAPSIFAFNKTLNGNTNNRSCIYTSTIEKDAPIIFSIDDNKKYITPKYGELYQTKSKYKWTDLDKLGEKPIVIKTIKDNDCQDKTIKPPRIALRYDKFNLDESDEIQDIYFDIKTNKNIEDININVLRDGTLYLPKKETSKKIYTPHHIDNVIHEYNSTINIQQPNITICSNCMKTSLGYYDKCPHCSSELVTHQKEKEDVTICYNCGWITDGWRTTCKHCLSKDVVRTTVDYNKTYCYNCQSMHDDYYNVCPYCFSTNVIHLQNDSDMYRIYNQDITNIEPIVIQSDIKGALNICNITIPLNQYSKKLYELESLTLVANVTNNNNGEYYYCESCETAGLGNPEKCPYCNESNPEKYHTVNLFDDNGNKQHNLTMYVSSVVNGETRKCEITPNGGNIDGNMEIEIPILDLAKNNSRDNFNIIIDIENTTYQTNQNKIKTQLPISNYGEKYLNEVLKSTFIDMSVNNFYFKSDFINENKWDIQNIEGESRSGVRYITDKDETNYLSFHFDVDLDKVNDIEFYMSGINKSLSYARMNINVLSNGRENIIKTYAKSNIFEIKENIFDKKINARDITIEVNFYDVNLNSEIIINECYLIASKHNTKITIPTLTEQDIIVDNYADKHYKISSKNMWGINEIAPKYLTGKILETGLLACLEFDKIDVGETFKIYDIKMFISYKNKFGDIITGALVINEDYLTTQMVNATVTKHNSENWGAFRLGFNGLNNLEYEVINTNDEKLLDSVPVLNKISQSFISESDSIYKLILRCAGQAGYPDDYVTVSIYDDYNNQPDVCLASKKVLLPSIIKDVEIDFNIEKLNKNERYWIIIEDKSANEFNYHKIRHNTHKEVGNLYITKNNETVSYDHMALSFAIEYGYEIREFIEYPHTCELDNDENVDFKLYDSLYRLDAQTSSNIYLTNLLIKSGYKVCGEDDLIPRDDEEETEVEYEEWTEEDDGNQASDSLTEYPNCTDNLGCISMPMPQDISNIILIDYDANDYDEYENNIRFSSTNDYEYEPTARVIDATTQSPISGMQISLYIDNEFKGTYTTDSDGMCYMSQYRYDENTNEYSEGWHLTNDRSLYKIRCEEINQEYYVCNEVSWSR